MAQTVDFGELVRRTELSAGNMTQESESHGSTCAACTAHASSSDGVAENSASERGTVVGQIGAGIHELLLQFRVSCFRHQANVSEQIP